jgi:hypothetical protein
MSRKFIVAIAAVAAVGMSLVATDAFARGGGGHGGGGGFHGGGGSRGGIHARTTMPRTVTRTHRNVTRTTHVNKTRHAGRPNVHRPNPHRPHRPHYARHHHGHHYWWWCRHHPYRCNGTWIDVGVDGGVAPIPVAAPAPVVAAVPPAAVCTNDCDYFVKDEPGCYMAKRAFSTPMGDELRCVKICEEPEGKRAEK